MKAKRRELLIKLVAMFILLILYVNIIRVVQSKHEIKLPENITILENGTVRISIVKETHTQPVETYIYSLKE